MINAPQALRSGPEEAGGPLPGSVSEQFIRCGKAGCRCQNGPPHGPYFYRIWRGEGRAVHKVYVKRAELEQVRARCAEYRAVAEELRALRARRLALTALLWVQVARSRCLRGVLPRTGVRRARRR